YQQVFRTLVGGMPSTGLLVLNGDDTAVRALADDTYARVRFFGLGADHSEVTATEVQTVSGGQSFQLTVQGEPLATIALPMSGRHNLLNALAVCALALDEGLTPQQIADGFATFQGMKRRQEVRGEAGGVLVIDDFAHHPTAVRETIRAVQARWPERRVVAIFEPRSNSSRRKIFEQPYSEAFDDAALAFLSAPPFRHNDDTSTFMNTEAVVQHISARGISAHLCPNADELLVLLLDHLRPGDVALLMSNGSFGGLHQRLLEALAR